MGTGKWNVGMAGVGKMRMAMGIMGIIGMGTGKMGMGLESGKGKKGNGDEEKWE